MDGEPGACFTATRVSGEGSNVGGQWGTGFLFDGACRFYCALIILIAVAKRDLAGDDDAQGSRTGALMAVMDLVTGVTMRAATTQENGYQ